MLESEFPGINVVLANYPPPLPKRILGKVVPVVQTGIIVAIVAGDQIFPRLGITPPPWYYSFCANKFRSIASTWLLTNFLQSFLQSSGAFEVYCNGDLVSTWFVLASYLHAVWVKGREGPLVWFGSIEWVGWEWKGPLVWFARGEEGKNILLYPYKY